MTKIIDSKEIHVILISTSYLPKINGTTVAVHSIAARLKERGYPVCVVTKVLKDGKTTNEVDGFPVLRVRTERNKITGNLRFFLISLRIIRGLTKRGNFVIHAHGIVPGLIASFLKISKRHRFVITIHQIPRSSFSRLLFRLVSHNADIITAQSSVIRFLFSMLLRKSDHKKITIIPNLIDIRAFRNNIEPAQAFELKKVLYVGDLGSNKGVDLLILAMKNVVKAVPEASLDIVGKGRQFNSLLSLAKECGLESRIRFLGELSHDKVINAYDNCSVLALPSFMELFPTVILEASLMARPVVATRTIGAVSLIKSGKSGLIVDQGDVDGLASSIIRLLNDRRLYLELSAYAKEYMVKSVCGDDAFNSLLLLYSSIM